MLFSLLICFCRYIYLLPYLSFCLFRPFTFYPLVLFSVFCFFFSFFTLPLPMFLSIPLLSLFLSLSIPFLQFFLPFFPLFRKFPSHSLISLYSSLIPPLFSFSYPSFSLCFSSFSLSKSPSFSPFPLFLPLHIPFIFSLFLFLSPS